MKLVRCDSIELRPTPPFNFKATFHKPSHFPSNDVLFRKNEFYQGLHLDGLYGLKFENKGTLNDPRILLIVYNTPDKKEVDINQIKNEIEFRYDLKADLNEFYRRFELDGVLGTVLKRWRGVRVSCAHSLYEFLMVTTVLQNATARRSIQMFDALLKSYGIELGYDRIKIYSLWQPGSMRKVKEEELRALKIGYRAKTIKKISDTFSRGDVDELELRKLRNDKLRIELMKIYGVGPASVQYIMFEVFKRYDALDYLPPWEQKIYSRALFGESVSVPVSVNDLLAYMNERWAEYRMLAAHYLFEDLFWRRKEIGWLEKEIRR